MGRKTTSAAMVRAMEIVREQAALARRQSENPYNHSCKELHVRKVFGDMATALEAAAAAFGPGRTDAKQ